MFLGLYTKKEVEALKEDYEVKLLRKDEVIHDKDKSNDFLSSHNNDLAAELKYERKINSNYCKTFNLINKERQRFLNTKSIRIKKKYIKKIDKKLNNEAERMIKNEG